MARPKGPHDGEEDLTGKVIKALRERGLPLEMRVARSFRVHGFTVTPSHYVNVPEARRPREIDVLAVHTRVMMSARMSFEIYVECKWSRNRPWVVFASRDAIPAASIVLQSVLTNSMGDALLWLFQDDLEDWRIATLRRPQLHLVEDARFIPFSSSAINAHGGVRVIFGEKGEGGHDAFYRAMQSVTSIARAGVGVRDTYAIVDSARDAAFAFPVVVVDGPLFEASLAEDSDELIVKRISRARIHWRGARAGDMTNVDIVTAESIDGFAAECANGIKAACDEFLLLAHSEVLDALNNDSPDPLRARLHGRTLSPPIVVPTVLRALANKLANEKRQG